MKFPTYAEATHNGAYYQHNAEYAIDWKVGERKYKEIYNGIRVYENDLVQIIRSGRNNPMWRLELSNRFDCHFTLLSELTNVTLHDPETGSRVHKKHLSGTLYFYDMERGRLYSVGGWGNADITFVSKHAQPSVLDNIVYYLPNKPKEKALHDSLAKHRELGATLLALAKPGDYSYRYFSELTRRVLGFDKPVPRDLTSPKVQAMCKEIVFNRIGAASTIFRASRTEVTTQYVEVR